MTRDEARKYVNCKSIPEIAGEIASLMDPMVMDINNELKEIRERESILVKRKLQCYKLYYSQAEEIMKEAKAIINKES